MKKIYKRPVVSPLALKMKVDMLTLSGSDSQPTTNVSEGSFDEDDFQAKGTTAPKSKSLWDE